jgi:hypothetical protein
MEPIQHMRENPRKAAKTIAKGAAIGVGVGLASTVLLPASPFLLPAAVAGAGVLKSRAASKGRQQAAGKVQTDKLTAFRDAQRQQRVKDADRVDQEQEAQLMAQAASQAESDRIAMAARDAARKMEEQRNLASAIASAMGTQGTGPATSSFPVAPKAGIPVSPDAREQLVDPKPSFDEMSAPSGKDI